VAYQPNPFVNPDKRDIDLPGGCKDLNEVLEKGTTVQPTLSLRRYTGTIWSLKDMLYQFDKEKCSDERLTIRHPNSGVLLILSRAEGSYKLVIRLHREETRLRDTIIEIFGEATLKENAEAPRSARTILIPLSRLWDEVAQTLGDLLIRGYGLPDGANLVFEYY
jgi:hypothetical protein